MGENKNDLTDIDDLSEYLHELDPETEDQVEDFSNIQVTSIDQLPDIPNTENQNSDFDDNLLGPDPFEDDLQEEDNLPLPPLEDIEEFQQPEDNLDLNNDISNLDIFDSTITEEENEDENEDENSLFQDDQIFSEDPLQVNISEDSNLEFDDITSMNVKDDFQENIPDQPVVPEAFNEELLTNDPLEKDLNVKTPLDNSYFENNSNNLEINQTIEKKTPPETFDDVKQFAENISYGHVSTGGNPPFSMIIEGIKYLEDANEITDILQEHGVINDSNKNIFSTSIQNGSLLLSQISEYAAIYLTHKLRRFDISIKMGLSEEIRPSSSTKENKGLINKKQLTQNKNEYVTLIKNEFTLDEIITSTMAKLEQFDIKKYIEIITETIIVDGHDLAQHEIKINHFDQITNLYNNKKSDIQLEKNINISNLYKQMINKLKQKAHQLGGNGIIGINFQVSPITVEDILKYQITCIGNVVLLTDIIN